MRKRTRSKKNSLNTNKYLLAGLTMSSALVLSRPVFPVVVYATDANKYSWTKQNLDLIGGETFSKTASSASGSNLIASSVYFNGPQDEPHPLYVSSNYGSTWQNVAETADPGVVNIWMSVDVSNDGQTMMAASSEGYDLDTEEDVNGKIMLSRNAGASWTDISSDISSNLVGGETYAVVSGDGSTVAVTRSNEVYITEDSGDNWTATDVSIDDYNELWSISISDNGDKLLVGDAGSGSEFDSFYISEDSGANWTGLSTPAPNKLHYGSSAISADGSTIAVSGLTFDGGEPDYVFTSKNDGATWTDVTPDDDPWDLWTSIDMSDDGKKISILGVDYEPNTGGEDVSMYVSDDSGANWTQENVDADNQGSIYDFFLHSNVDLNADGSRAIIGRVGGVYTGITKPSVSLSDAEGGKTITITTPDGTTITCSSAVKESAQTKQDSGYNYPLGLVNFCFDTAGLDNEVSLTFVSDLKPNQALARKYNPTTQTYLNIPGAVITETTLEGQHALTVTYTITDNGQLDIDPETGKITDPVGIAVTGTDLAATGDNSAQLTVIASIITIASTVVLQKRHKWSLWQ